MPTAHGFRLTRVAMAVALGLAVSVAGPASIGMGKNMGQGHGKGNSPSGNSSAGWVQITLSERDIIVNYIAGHRGVPVFAEAKPLPPGIAKKLARGGTLPPGIAKRYFPGDLVAQLPPRPGYGWIVAGTDVILIQIATNVVVDILQGAL
jgi:hypothetical protein